MTELAFTKEAGLLLPTVLHVLDNNSNNKSSLNMESIRLWTTTIVAG